MSELLETINSPQDLKLLSVEQLPVLCDEIRAFLIANAAANGGHFGSSLGVVELTVALHYVFDMPRDKIVWDVGHQAYVHKILTGRGDQFHTNRKQGGLSGFTKQSESEYDSFVAGHASISISAALGMATASHIKGETSKHIAVIGDGALTGGIAYEGLNNAGDSKADLLVILNDNQISIDPNVGAMTKMLVNITSSRRFNKIRNGLKSWLQHHGKLGQALDSGAYKFEKSVKNLMFSDSNMFEALNFQYFGPLDGHDVMKTVKLLRKIKNYPGPKLLHCLTVKGKGFAPAEAEQIKWHATEGFDEKTVHEEPVETGKTQSAAPIKYQDVFGETLVELAEQNEKIVAITPAMPSGCSLNKMMERFPDRAFDVGIAEQHAVTFAAGLATQGLVPFCNIYSTFAQRAYDQIIHDVAIEKTPVRFCLDRAGLVGADGETHQGAFDIAYLRAIPNLIIAAPRNEIELRHLMFTFSRYQKGPTFVRYPRGKGHIIDWKKPFKTLEIGKGECLKEGHKLAVISVGTMAHNVSLAIEEMQNKEAIAHYDLRFIKPLDENLLKGIFQKFNQIIVVEEGVINGGAGSAILELASLSNYRGRVTRLGLPDKFIAQGTPEEQQKECGLDGANILKVINNVLSDC
jgi:1-deoxy-D-xylulose-5-phosphate synthase